VYFTCIKTKFVFLTKIIKNHFALTSDSKILSIVMGYLRYAFIRNKSILLLK